MSLSRFRVTAGPSFRCCLAVLLTAVGVSSFGQTHPGKVGIGLEGIGGRAMEFVDAARTARSFEGPDGGAVAKDAAGWPNADCSTVLFDARPVAAWEGVIDDPEQYQIDMTGTYKMSFNGQADISVRFGNFTIANKVYNSTTNTTTADLINNNPLCAIRFTNTRKTSGSALNTGISNLKVNRPGYDLNTTQLFHTPFIAALNNANFAAMRFMDWTHTNNNNATYPATSAWSQRPLMNKSSDALWDDNVKMLGAPWETVVLLANQVNKDVWINVPVSASDDYVTKLAQLLRYGSDGVNPYTTTQSNPVFPPLNSNRNIYVELSNEVWNSIFSQQPYAVAAGQALGITEHQWVARRTAQVRNLFSNVFGASAINNRVRVVLCNHAPMLQWWVQPQLEYINNNFGAPSNYIYMICRQGYFNPSGKTSSDTVATLLSKAQQDIDNQNAPDPTNNANRSQWIQKGTDWALVGKAGIYEGGPHFPCCSDMTVLANEIGANRAAGMRDLLQRNYGLRWADLGGTIAMHFTLSSGYNRYGAWGLTDDITNPDRNYKFEAMRNMLGTGGSAPAAPTGLIAAAGDALVTLDWTASSGATSYNVKRSTTSGSGYGTVGTSTDTHHNDTNLTNGTTYYYVVTAVNSAGESGNSNQASAMPSAPPSSNTANIAAGTATIDAAVEAAWGSAAAQSITNTVGSIGSTGDCSGTFKGLWDSTNLYVLAEVTDDNKSNDSTNPWEDDSVEIYVDGNNDKATSYDSNDRQYVFGWGDSAVVEGAGRSSTGVTFAKADPTSTSYRIEAKIPWGTLGVTASTGKMVGFDVHINDDDAGGAREGKKQWNDTTDTAWTNPGTFGTVTLQPPGGSGTISREVWTGVSGNDINLIPLSNTPNTTGALTSLEAPTSYGDSYGQRVRGYLTAPQTGSYTFWIASDDDGELWLSTTGSPANKVRIAYVDGWTSSRQWDKYASQKSAAVSLTAGQKYYVEALHKEGAGGDNLAVGWAKPGQSTTAPSEVIPGAQLSPWDGGSPPTAEASMKIAQPAPTIDGGVDGVWSNTSSYTCNNVISGTVSSSSDLSATWRGMWDGSNLYVLVDVTDDAKRNDSTNAWDDDSVELYVDGNNDKATSYDSNDRQYIFGWNDTAAIEAGGRNVTGVTFAKADPTSTSYRIEARVPWSAMGVSVNQWKLVGIDVHVNDDDNGAGRDGKKSWEATVDNSWANPSLFGTGRLDN